MIPGSRTETLGKLTSSLDVWPWNWYTRTWLMVKADEKGVDSLLLYYGENNNPTESYVTFLYMLKNTLFTSHETILNSWVIYERSFCNWSI